MKVIKDNIVYDLHDKTQIEAFLNSGYTLIEETEKVAEKPKKLTNKGGK